MNPKFWLFLGGTLLFAAFLFFSRKGAYSDFHKANIKGKIDTIYRYRDYVMIHVDGIEYRIIPVTLGGNKFRLDEIAQKGDSIIKPAGHDTLILKHESETVSNFLYSVKKY